MVMGRYAISCTMTIAGNAYWASHERAYTEYANDLLSKVKSLLLSSVLVPLTFPV